MAEKIVQDVNLSKKSRLYHVYKRLSQSGQMNGWTGGRGRVRGKDAEEGAQMCTRKLKAFFSKQRFLDTFTFLRLTFLYCLHVLLLNISLYYPLTKIDT